VASALQIVIWTLEELEFIPITLSICFQLFPALYHFDVLVFQSVIDLHVNLPLRLRL
jgi:hypothetical protein